MPEPSPPRGAAAPEPPALPAALLAPWPVIVVIATGWLIAVVLAFTVRLLLLPTTPAPRVMPPAVLVIVGLTPPTRLT